MSSITVPDSLPSPTQDSEKLREAFQGWGADGKPIITILGRRDANQRMKICQAYQQLYNESLIDRLKSELSGNFGKAIILWTMNPPQRDAELINDALNKKVPKHLSVIIEIACASSPSHLISVRQAYCSLYSCSLEEDVELHAAQPLRKLLVGMVSSYRCEREEVDGAIAKSEADRLHDAIQEQKLDQEHVIWILSTRNRFQLKETFSFYKQDYGKPIQQDIKDCNGSDFATLLRTAVNCIESPAKHFAEVIKSSVNGLGTDESALTRVIVTRAEVDLLKIKEEYQKLYEKSLVEDVVCDTSGDYKKFLVTLIGDGKLQWFG